MIEKSTDEVPFAGNLERWPPWSMSSSEKRFLPDTALETARLPPGLGNQAPREWSLEAIITRVTKANAAIIETAQESEINSKILLGAFLLNMISVNNTDMVNLVYSTQGEKPLTFKEASVSSLARSVLRWKILKSIRTPKSSLHALETTELKSDRATARSDHSVLIARNSGTTKRSAGSSILSSPRRFSEARNRWNGEKRKNLLRDAVAAATTAVGTGTKWSQDSQQSDEIRTRHTPVVQPRSWSQHSAGSED
jgi:hypothetical protein